MSPDTGNYIGAASHYQCRRMARSVQRENAAGPICRSDHGQACESELEGAFEVAQHRLELRGRLLERGRDALSLGFQVEIDVCLAAAHCDRDAVAPRPDGRGDAVSAALESPQHSAGSRGVQIFKRSAY